MNKIHEWVNTVLIVLVAILVLVGGNQSVPKVLGGAGLNCSSSTCLTGGLKVTGGLDSVSTTTVEGYPADFNLSSAFTVGTTTPVRATITNNGLNMVCNSGSIFVDATSSAAFNPSFKFVVGTTTTSGAYSANLMSSTTFATTSAAGDQIVGNPTGWTFTLLNGMSLTLSLGDNITNASSTNYGNWTGQFGLRCARSL